MAKTIEDYQKEWQAAKASGNQAAMNAAHAGAEAIRAAQGYSGGTSGNQNIPLSTGNVKATGGNAPTGLGYGTIVDTQGGQYRIVDPSLYPGAVQNPTSGYYSVKVGSDEDIQIPKYDNPFEDYYNQLLQAQQRGIEERLNAAIAANQAYIPQVDRQADKALQSAYVNRELARASTPEVLSAMGHTGGMSETALLGLEADYGTARRGIEESRAEALENIRQNEAQLRASGNVELANAAADYYNRLIASTEKQAQLQRDEYWKQKDFDFREREYQDKLAQLAIDNAYNERVLAGKSYGAGSTNYGTPTALTDDNYRQEEASIGSSPKFSIVLADVNRRLDDISRGASGSSKTIIDYIRSRTSSGDITEAEARYILKELGYEV